MLSLETYLDHSAKNAKTDHWDLQIHQDTQANLESTCKLVMIIFDTGFCRVVAHFSHLQVILSECSEENNKPINPLGTKAKCPLSLDTHPLTKNKKRSSNSSLAQRMI